ncbi:MAG: hypothetical protein AAF462_08930 [Thermodesulfobacteriota bacterium]
MKVALAYPSVSSFPQSSILLKREGRPRQHSYRDSPGCFYGSCCPEARDAWGTTPRGGVLE